MQQKKLQKTKKCVIISLEHELVRNYKERRISIILHSDAFAVLLKLSTMIIFHGSTDLVKKPEIRENVYYLDFGKGFYTTTSYEQAERWAQIKMHRLNKSVGYVARYEFDFEAAKKATNIVKFDHADMAWLQFVVGNRRGEPLIEKIDMHIGPVADDNVYRSIRLFETGVLDAEETVNRLKTKLLHDQWTFHTNFILSFVKFIDYTEISKGV